MLECTDQEFQWDHPGRWLMIRVRGTEKLTLKNSILGENNILGTIVMSFLYWVLFSLIRKLFRNISEEHSWSAVHQKNINSTKQYSVLFQHFRKIRICLELITLSRWCNFERLSQTISATVVDSDVGDRLIMLMAWLVTNTFCLQHPSTSV